MELSAADPFDSFLEHPPVSYDHNHENSTLWPSSIHKLPTHDISEPNRAFRSRNLPEANSSDVYFAPFKDYISSLEKGAVIDRANSALRESMELLGLYQSSNDQLQVLSSSAPSKTQFAPKHTQNSAVRQKDLDKTALLAVAAGQSADLGHLQTALTRCQQLVDGLSADVTGMPEKVISTPAIRKRVQAIDVHLRVAAKKVELVREMLDCTIRRYVDSRRAHIALTGQAKALNEEIGSQCKELHELRQRLTTCEDSIESRDQQIMKMVEDSNALQLRCDDELSRSNKAITSRQEMELRIIELTEQKDIHMIRAERAEALLDEEKSRSVKQIEILNNRRRQEKEDNAKAYAELQKQTDLTRTQLMAEKMRTEDAEKKTTDIMGEFLNLKTLSDSLQASEQVGQQERARRLLLRGKIIAFYAQLNSRGRARSSYHVWLAYHRRLCERRSKIYLARVKKIFNIDRFLIRLQSLFPEGSIRSETAWTLNRYSVSNAKRCFHLLPSALAWKCFLEACRRKTLFMHYRRRISCYSKSHRVSSSWRFWMEFRQRNRLSRHAGLLYHRRILRKCLEDLRVRTQGQFETKAKLDKMSDLRFYNGLKQKFARWGRFISWHRQVRVMIKRSIGNELRSALSHWQKRCIYMQRYTQSQVFQSEKRLTRLLSHVFTAWRLNTIHLECLIAGVARTSGSTRVLRSCIALHFVMWKIHSEQKHVTADYRIRRSHFRVIMRPFYAWKHASFLAILVTKTILAIARRRESTCVRKAVCILRQCAIRRQAGRVLSCRLAKRQRHLSLKEIIALWISQKSLRLRVSRFEVKERRRDAYLFCRRWRARVVQHKGTNLKLRFLRQINSVSHKRRVFYLWVQNRICVQKRKASVYRMRKNLILKTFVQFKCLKTCRRRLQSFVKLSQQNAQSKVIDTWLQQLNKLHATEKGYLLMKKRKCHFKIQMLFGIWTERVSENVSRRDKCRHFLLRLMKRSLAHSFRKWHAGLEYLKRIVHKIRSATSRLEKDYQRKIFYWVQHWTRIKRRLDLSRHRIALRRDQRCMTKTLKDWQAVSQSQRACRAKINHFLKKGILLRLRCFVARTNMIKATLSRVKAKSAFNLLYKILSFMLFAARRSRRLKVKVVSKNIRCKAKSFIGWARFFKEDKRINAAGKKLKLQQISRDISRFMAAWMNKVQGFMSRTSVRNFFGAKTSLLIKNRRQARPQLQVERIVMRVLGFFTKRNLVRALAQWKAFASDRQRMREFLLVSIARWCNIPLGKALRSWVCLLHNGAEISALEKHETQLTKLRTRLQSAQAELATTIQSSEQRIHQVVNIAQSRCAEYEELTLAARQRSAELESEVLQLRMEAREVDSRVRTLIDLFHVREKDSLMSVCGGSASGLGDESYRKLWEQHVLLAAENEDLRSCLHQLPEENRRLKSDLHMKDQSYQALQDAVTEVIGPPSSNARAWTQQEISIVPQLEMELLGSAMPALAMEGNKIADFVSERRSIAENYKVNRSLYAPGHAPSSLDMFQRGIRGHGDLSLRTSNHDSAKSSLHTYDWSR